MTLDHSVYGPEMQKLLDEFARTEVVAPGPAKQASKFHPGVRVSWSKVNPQFGTVAMKWIEDTKWAVQLDQHPPGSYTLLFESQMKVV